MMGGVKRTTDQITLLQLFFFSSSSRIFAALSEYPLSDILRNSTTVNAYKIAGAETSQTLYEYDRNELKWALGVM